MIRTVNSLLAKTLCFFLSVVLIVGYTPMAAFANNGGASLAAGEFNDQDGDAVTQADVNAKQDASELVNGDLVYFGRYFQDGVSDDQLVEKLNDMEPENVSGKYVRELSGVRYTLASHRADNGVSYNYYFGDAPLRWYVLDDAGDSYTLISERVIDARSYYDTKDGLDLFWGDSTVRRWLNGEFMDLAFTESEQADIVETTVMYDTKGGGYPYGNNGDPEWATVKDKVYLIDGYEIKLEIFSNANVPVVAQATPYVDLQENYYEYWLRGGCKYRYGNLTAAYISSSGNLETYYPTWTKGIRPVIRVSKNAEGLSVEKPEITAPDNEEDEYIVTATDGSFTTVYNDEARTFRDAKGFRYRDSYFYENATEYNHSLATMSLCMAFAAYGMKPYEDYDANIHLLMLQCGFANGTRYKQYHFNEVPEQNYIGCAMGSKKITVDGKTFTLIAVAVRGGGYEDEWASNFDVGSSGDHTGFDLNADRVKDYVIDYVQENGISGDVKIWITGFSRAGAVATQAAAKLDDLSGFAYEDEKSDSGYTRVDFDKESIYAYGFATPAGACKASDPHSEDYSNIWNVIEYNDPVPLVAPENWEFGRYGTTKILPYRESNDVKKYGAYFERMRERLNAGHGFNIDGFKSYLQVPANWVDKKNHDTQGTYLRKFVRALVGVIGNRAKYYDKYQYEVEAIVENKMGGEEKNSDLGSVMYDIFDDFLPKIAKFSVLHPNLLATLSNNCSTLFEVHADQDYYLGWMQLMDENYDDNLPLIWGDPSYRVFRANCPVDVYVYDSDGEIVAYIKDDEPSEDDGQSVIVSIDENGQKVAYLPNGSVYRVEVETREDCDVSCGIEETNAEHGNPVRITNFETTWLESGESMMATIPSISDDEIDDAASFGSNVFYEMIAAGEGVEIASDIAGSDAVDGRTFDVVVSFDEAKGQVYGGGSFVEGSFSRLEAVSNEGYTFDGFYIDGKKYEDADSGDVNIVRFKVTGDTAVETKFIKDNESTPSVDGKGVARSHRLWGQMALDTMSEIVDAGPFTKGGTVVLATSEGYWDALTAAGVAGLADAPVLMTSGSSLSPQTKAQIQKLEPKTIVICGGTAAVKPAVENAAKSAAGGAAVVRCAGQTATGTACEIFKAGKRFGAWSDVAFVCTNDGYWDALAAAPVSYARHMPIFLTEGSSSISDETLDAMRAGGVNRVFVVGGNAAIAPAVETQLRGAGIAVSGRLWGNTAIETSEAVASFGTDSMNMSADNLGVATSSGYWDALAGAALCGSKGSVLVLVDGPAAHSIKGFVKSKANAIADFYIFGGEAAVDAATESAVIKAAK